MARGVVRMARDKRERRLAGRRMPERTTLRRHRTMNDIDCFLLALQRFAALSHGEQRQLITDVRQGRDSRRPVNAVRELLAEAVDGCEDEEIADALRDGIDEGEGGSPATTPDGIAALVVDLVQSIDDLEEVHDLIGREVLRAIGRA